MACGINLGTLLALQRKLLCVLLVVRVSWLLLYCYFRIEYASHIYSVAFCL
uniref:Uncharacterized protein n=1 Tax=Arundo donax TaxID=35708 RepID=A0A0A8XTY4_ARUDO